MGERPPAARPTFRPRLRTVLLTVNLLILLLPVGGIAWFRLYENELVRSAETQLIVQGAFVRELYLERYRQLAPADRSERGISLPPGWRPTFAPDGRLHPRPAVLDLSTAPVLAAAPEALAAVAATDRAAALAGEEIAPLLARAGRVALAGIRVVDSRGVVVATSGSELGLSLAHREEVAAALEGRDVSLLRRRVSDEPPPPLQSISRGQRYRIFVALPVIDGDRLLGAVVLSRTPLDIAKALYLNRQVLLAGAATLFGVVVLVSLLTSLTISRPVRALIRQAEQISRGDRAVPVVLRRPGTHELARLSESLDEMARALGQRAEYIRTFAAHVSHEFKTPLTTIRGTVELLAERLDEMSADERDRFLGNLERASCRLEHLVRRLLRQAEADVARPGDEITDVDAALDAVARVYREEGLDVTLGGASRPALARMNEETLREIVGGLLDNARVHGGGGVRVKIAVRVDASARPAWIEIDVVDDGAGVSAANAGRIFTPFFTTARDRGGSGLGLSIVKSLLEAHGGSVELLAGTVGATFRLRLPAAERERPGGPGGSHL